MQDQLAEALAMHQDVLRVRVSVLGLKHPDVAMSYSKCAHAYSCKAHSNVCIMWVCSIGSVYMEMGEYEKALDYYNQGLQIVVKVYGLDHQLVVDTKNKCALSFQYGLCARLLMVLCSIAVIRAQVGDLAVAVNMWQDVLRIQEKHLGRHHPDVAGTKNKYIHIGFVLVVMAHSSMPQCPILQHCRGLPPPRQAD